MSKNREQAESLKWLGLGEEEGEKYIAQDM
jgi:hypothetical protein